MHPLMICSEDLRTFSLDVRAVRAVLPLAGDPGGRPELAGVLLTGTHVVATDSHVMGVVEIAEPFELAEPVLLPTWAAGMLARSGEDSALVAVDGRSVLVGYGGELLPLQGMPADLYPDWHRVVPFGGWSRVRASRHHLTGSVRAAPLSTPLSWSGDRWLHVAATSYVAADGRGYPFALRLNREDFLRTLQGGPASVVLEVWSSDVPLVMRDTLPCGVGERTRLLLPLPEKEGSHVG